MRMQRRNPLLQLRSGSQPPVSNPRPRCFFHGTRWSPAMKIPAMKIPVISFASLCRSRRLSYLFLNRLLLKRLLLNGLLLKRLLHNRLSLKASLPKAWLLNGLFLWSPLFLQRPLRWLPPFSLRLPGIT